MVEVLAREEKVLPWLPCHFYLVVIEQQQLAVQNQEEKRFHFVDLRKNKINKNKKYFTLLL